MHTRGRPAPSQLDYDAPTGEVPTGEVPTSDAQDAPVESRLASNAGVRKSALRWLKTGKLAVGEQCAFLKAVRQTRSSGHDIAPQCRFATDFRDGPASYSGTLDEFHRPHGFGTFVFRGSEFPYAYRGQWSHGRRSGPGIWSSGQAPST